MTMRNIIRIRIGTPGGSNLPYEITNYAGEEDRVIVYARTTVDAVNLFSIESGGCIEQFDVRLMSDGE